ncbi:MAG TPA: amino acid adenylation domain-containing protein [Pyrinomonadaceae bacterium]|nr:amino acid adenylation domain-containing protein [Pyrinomonadaceae bacterium]
MSDSTLSLERRELLSLLLEEEGVELLHTPTVAPRDERVELPLSFAQQRLWFLYQWQPDTAVYNIPIFVRLHGRLDIPALEQTLNEIIRRHESLRTTFALNEGRPFQIVAPSLRLTLPVTDLSHMPKAEREAEAQRLALEESQQPFNLEHGPLLRVKLLRLDEEDYVALLTMHHIISDAWSRNVLINEVTALYDAFSKKQSSPLPELPFQYADFAVWQREWLQGEVLEQQLAYWRKQLAGLAVLELPTDRRRPSVQTFRGAQHMFVIPGPLADRLQALSLLEGVTLFMTVAAAFKILLSRYSGQKDISIGTPIANRNRAEFDRLIGFFINTLVLRTDLSGDPTVRELLQREREVALGAYAHQDIPFEKLVEELQPDRDLSRTPLFQVMFALQNVPRETLALPELNLTSFGIELTTAKFDLTLMMEDTSQGLFGAFDYNTDLFDAATMTRMANHFEQVLTAMVSNSDERISRLQLLTSDEGKLFEQWNETRRAYQTDLPLQHFIEEQAAQSPSAIAVVFEKELLTYRQLNERANQLAHYLRQAGNGTESVVGILMERSSELVIALLATLKAGAAYLPLDPSYPSERLSFMLADGGVSVLLTQQRLKSVAKSGVQRVLCVDSEWEESVAGFSEENPVVQVEPENLAYVIYTSGSTGQPKGAMNTQRALVNRLLWMQETYQLGPADVVLQKTPYSFDVSVWEFFWPLMVGARLVLARPGGHQDSGYLCELIKDAGVTTLHFVPSMLAVFVEEESVREQCESLRLVISSGEALSEELSERCYERLGEQVKLHNLYGPTEAAIDVSAWECERGSRRGNVPIGRPIANLTLHILDEGMRAAPVGVAGELYIGGVGLGRGYWGRPELTAEKFVPHPYSVAEGARLYRTGDVARWAADGAIEYQGRVDHQVKVRGFRIELGEVEAALRGHGSVREAVVVARAEAGSAQLVAYVVASGAEGINSAELRRYVGERLPEYMVPAVMVELEELPLLPNGKLNRRALPAIANHRPDKEPYVAPRNLVEEVLAEIWSDVLGIEQVGINDNYFAVGGDSIRSLRIISLARARGMEFSLQQLFRHQTIAELAAELTLNKTNTTARVTTPFSLVTDADHARLPEGLEDAYPLTMLQAGMFYHMQMMPESAVYHNVNTCHLRAKFDHEKFEEAVRRVVARHPMLRTSFNLATYSEPLQLVHATATLPLKVEDLRHVAPADQDKILAAFIEAERTNRFDISQAPLIRFFIHRRTDETFQFSLTENHVINDGWSLTSTLAEIFGCYFALLAGANPPLEPPLTVTFRDYVMQERMALDSAECRRYWDDKLADANIMKLPRVPASYRQTADRRFYEIPVPISVTLTEELKRVARTAKAPLKSVLLAAHLKALSIISGQTDVMGGITSNGRAEEAGGDQVRGLFLNSLPVRVDLAGGTWLDLVRRAFEAEWEMLPYRRYPLIALQQKYNGQPLFETQFNYVHFHTLEGVMRSGEVEMLASNVRGVEETHFTLEADFGLDVLSSQAYLTVKGDATELGVEQLKNAAAYYTNILEAIARDPHAQHDTVSLLSPNEQRQLLVEWNNTSAFYPQDKCLHQLFEEQVERTPDAPALVFEGRRLSYRDLNRRANQMAHYLRRLGVETESRVGILMESSVGIVVSLLAIHKAGGAYVPIDSAYPKERIAFMLDDAQIEILLTNLQLAESLPPHRARVISPEIDGQRIAAESEENLPRTATSENLAYIIYTSGSTGLPKGAMLPHRGVVNCFASMQQMYRLTERDRMLLRSAISFDASVWEVFWPLTVGASVVIARPGGQKDTAYIVDTIIEQQITIVYFVPSMLSVFLDERRLEEATSLKQVICGGESLPIETVQRFYNRLHAELHHSYGPTEISIAASEWICEREGKRQVIPIGRPLANTQIYLLDRYLQPVPVGTPGEMYVGGDGLGRGYWNRPELTAEKFIPDVFSATAGMRLYRTGDLARYLPDGIIEFLGRVDYQVKIRGLRVELGEIESAICSHAAVKDVVVMAREDKPGDKRVIAYVIAAEAARPTHSELLSYLREKLPEHMIPAAFVWLEEWPLMTNGKVDRRRLPIPDEARPDLATEYVAPRTEVEQIVASIWQQVLQVEKVGLHDNFFDLGGHSLRMLQVNGKLREAFKQDISMIEMFQYPTIDLLAGFLSRELGTTDLAQHQHTEERTETRKRMAKQQKQLRQAHRAATMPRNS